MNFSNPPNFLTHPVEPSRWMWHYYSPEPPIGTNRETAKSNNVPYQKEYSISVLERNVRNYHFIIRTTERKILNRKVYSVSYCFRDVNGDTHKLNTLYIHHDVSLQFINYLILSTVFTPIVPNEASLERTKQFCFTSNPITASVRNNFTCSTRET